MTNKVIIRFLLVLASLASYAANAVEPYKPVIQLFDEDELIAVAGIDISSTAGIEALGGTDAIEVTSVAAPGKVRSRALFNLRLKNAANNATLGTFKAFVDTKNYPDPATAVATNYYCEDGDDFWSVDPNFEDFPCDFDINAGVANSGATRFFVMSLAPFVYYENSTDGFVDISQVSLTVWNPSTFAQKWRKTWGVLEGSWELSTGLSAVGDFLAADGVDEVRIVYERERSGDRIEMRYIYYNIANGNEIKEERFVMASP